MTQLDMVKATFAGISAGDVARATRHIGAHFVQHNPYAADGVEGLARFVRAAPREELQLEVVRAIEDGAYVVTHSTGKRSGKHVFFDIFRFEDEEIVEHWAFAAADAPPNRSGHTQTDGPTEPTHLEQTEANKALVRTYYETFHLRGDHGQNGRFFAGDTMIRHEPGVRDGIEEFLRDVAVLMQERTIDTIRFVLGEGDLVFIAAEGMHQSKPCVYIDLYRVEQERLVEHWGFPEMVPPPDERRNSNSML